MRFIFFLFLYLNCTLAFALGLGDIELKSHLNEALSVRITLGDTEPASDSACFTATDASEVSAFKRAYVTLKKANGVSQLNIITYDIITEPIVNLLVTFHCDPTINREYVLLMDPAPILGPEVAVAKQTVVDQPIPSAPKLKRKIVKPQPEPVLDSALPSMDVATEKPVKKKHKKTRAATIEEKLAQAYTGKNATETQSAEPKLADAAKPQPALANKANTDKPYLVISGSNVDTSSNDQPNLSLRMETQIDFTRTETAPLPASTEDADEVMVMTNRLAHLEKQILSLQAKNTRLLAENEKNKNESFSVSPAVSEWLQRILIGLGIIGVLAVAELLRRKIMLNRLQQDEAVWFDAESGDKNVDDLPDSKNISASIFNEPLEQTGFASQTGFVQAENDEVENVLDHADVFIEHGRPALAIQLLQNHLEDTPAESPAVWMKLLSLLAKEGTESDYETAVRECNQFFNIKMPSFADAMTQDYSTIEDHPHIITRLEGVWGSQYAIGFLNDLIYNQQSQPREGFDRNTFEELFFLKQIATILQSNSPGTVATYKPEVVKPLLENVEINRTVFAASDATNSGSENIAGASNEDHQQYERTSQLPAHTHEDRFAETDNVNDINNAEMDVIPETDVVKDDFSKQTYEIDIVLDAEEISPEPATPQALDFEAIDFDVSTEEIEIGSTEVPVLSAKTQPMKPVPETNFDIEESDADIINKYLSEAEEKAKKKPAPAKESNVIEFEWDLPKIHKD